jgi:hypothetical protein
LLALSRFDICRLNFFWKLSNIDQWSAAADGKIRHHRSTLGSFR